MANNQNHQLDTEQARELLSSYLDGEVTDAERIQVEQALAASPELQRDLETVRRTIALVAALPVVAAPHPFTLTEAQVKPAKPGRAGFLGLPGWFKGVAVLAATLLCVLAAGGFFLSMQFGGSQQAAEVAIAPATAIEAPATAQVAAQEAADQAGAAAREEVAPAAKATEEDRGEVAAAAATPPPEPTTVPTAEIIMAAPAQPPVAAKEVPPADESTALESQTITQAYEASPAEQSAAGAAAAEASPPPAALALPELTATPSPVPSVAVLVAPTQELLQEKTAANGEAEAGQMASASAPAPDEAPVETNTAGSAEVQTDQMTTESAPAPTPEMVEQKQAAPTATRLPQPSATPAAMLTLPVPETPPATFTPAPPVESGSGNWGLTLVAGVAALLVIVGLIIWLISRASKQTPS